MLFILQKTKLQMHADKRRFVARGRFVFIRLYLHTAPYKNHEASPQSAPSPQRGGGAGVKEDGGQGKHKREGARSRWYQYNYYAMNFPALRG